jgi:hypothetical protein
MVGKIAGLISFQCDCQPEFDNSNFFICGVWLGFLKHTMEEQAPILVRLHSGIKPNRYLIDFL